MKKPEWLKTLSEKATHGKVKYATMLVPFVGDWIFSDFIPSDDLKKARLAITLATGTVRTGGLAAGIITGNPLYFIPYWGLTIGEEVGNGLPNLFKYVDEKKGQKSKQQETMEENWKHKDVTYG